MVANIRGYTPNYDFKLINFDTPRWHTLEYDNWSKLDALLTQTGVPNFRGEWIHSTLYNIGDRVQDGEEGHLYRALVQHSSAPSGTFADERAAHPEYWVIVIPGVPIYIGEWGSSQTYAQGDIVFIDYDYFLCVGPHFSTATFDPLYWQQIFSAESIVLDAQTAASAAEASAAAAAVSETNAAASAAAAAVDADDAALSAEASAAAQGAFKWNYDSATAAVDPGTGDVRFNSAFLPSATVMMISSSTMDTGNPDVSDWIATWDDSTNPNIRGTVYVRKVGAPQNFFVANITGVVQDLGTWLQMPITPIAFGGAINNNDDVTIAYARAGDRGASGPGGGDMLSTNNLSDVDDAVSAAANLGLGTTSVPTFAQINLNNLPTIATHVATKQYVDDLPDPPQPLYISDTPPVGASDNAMWWDSDAGVLYVRYNDGDSSQWVSATAVPVIDTSSFVVKTGDTMAGALVLPSDPANPLEASTKQYVDAAETNANQYTDGLITSIQASVRMTARNRVVNGDMFISQENGDAAGTTANYYMADQWATSFSISGVGAVSSKRQATITPKGSLYRARITITTAIPAPVSTDYIFFTQAVEGFRFADFKFGSASARRIIVRFGWRSPAGTYSLAIRNSDATRTFLANFTIPVEQANNDTEQVILIPGDVTGTWTYSNTTGMTLCFAILTNADLNGVAGWNAGNKIGTSANTNGAAVINNTFDLFDVGMYLDLDGSGIPPHWERPEYTQEIVLCRRYWRLNDDFRTTFVGSTTAIRAIMPIEPYMRTSPAVSIRNGTGGIHVWSAALVDLIAITANNSQPHLLDISGTGSLAHSNALASSITLGVLNVSARL